MARELSREELDELLGAYALDAVDDDDREQIERYLERSPRARAEVESFREAAALLAHQGTDAPGGLWDRIAAATEEEPPRLDFPSVPNRQLEPASVIPLAPRRRTISLRLVSALAASAAVAIGLLGVELVRENHRLDRAHTALRGGVVERAAEQARTERGARTATLTSADGTRKAKVVYLSDGTGFFSENNLARLPASRTYQLWALIGDAKDPTVISAAVLGHHPGVAPFRIPGPVFGFVVTDEQAPGVASSDRPAIVQGALPEA